MAGAVLRDVGERASGVAAFRQLGVVMNRDEHDPRVRLRFELDHYVNLRPTRVYPGVPTPLADPGDVDGILVSNHGGRQLDTVLSGADAPALTGLPRQKAYEIVQRSSMRAWRERRSFLEILGEDPAVTERLAADELKSCFDPAWYLRHVDAVFRRAGLLP